MEMGIYKANMWSWVLGASHLPADGELGVASSCLNREVLRPRGVPSRETQSKPRRVGKSPQVLRPRPFLTLSASSLLTLFLFSNRTPLDICIPVKDWFILPTLCYMRDFSFDVSYCSISHIDGDSSSELISVISFLHIFSNSQTLLGKTMMYWVF